MAASVSQSAAERGIWAQEELGDWSKKETNERMNERNVTVYLKN
jgi:hypothetical protein